jgi:hypothetical protein
VKGKTVFTAEEAKQIRALLDNKGTVYRADQKKARSQLRKLGFFITDFVGSPDSFGVVDFDGLVKSGRIKITAV